MAYSTPPAKTEISATPSPSNAEAKAGFGKLWDWLTAILGTGGKPEHVYDALKFKDPRTILNLKPTFAVGANALTITVKGQDDANLSADNPGFVAQRHATISSGAFNLRKLEANLSLVISAGSTLGHVANFLLPIYLYVIDNAGVQELAASRSFMGESGIVSTTAEGGAGAADSATVMYSTTARASVPFRLIGIAWFNQTVAGNWVNLPSEVKQAPFLLEQVGEQVDYMGGTVPYGYYLEDGSNKSRTGEPAKLYAAIGTTWGVGDGSTTYTLPDSRRRTSVGSGGTGTGTLGNAVGNVGGEEAHTPTVAETAVHGHQQQVNTGNNTGGNTFGVFHQAQNNNGLNVGSTSNAGSGNAFNVVQPSMVVTKMIRWLGDIC